MSRPLFAEIIPVSEQEIQNWLDTIPNLSALPSRREAYRKAYNVEEKIMASKISKIKPLFLKARNKAF